jgi:catecholate siderophore receptor
LASETNKQRVLYGHHDQGLDLPGAAARLRLHPVYDPNPNDPWTGTIIKGVVSESARNETTGVYALDSIAIGDKWLLNLGLRYDDYRSRAATRRAPWPRRSMPTSAATGTSSTIRSAWSTSRPANSSVYASSFATSSTPPTISAGDQNTGGGNGTGNLANTLLDPEESTSYEVGAKANLFRDRLPCPRLGLHTESARTPRSVDGTTTPVTYAQAGEVEVEGIELGVSGNITRQWQVFGGYTYHGLRTGAPHHRGRQRQRQGDPLANTPEHSFSLFTTYRVTPKLSLGGGVYYVSTASAAIRAAPAAARTGLCAGVHPGRPVRLVRPDRHASLQLNVQNAGDEEYIMRTNGVHHADPAPAFGRR